MNYLLIDFERDVKNILKICIIELEKITNGEKTQATRDQIENFIIPEMKSFLEMIQNGEIPPKEKRWVLSAANITRVWAWDIWVKNILAKKLLALDNNYRNKLIL